MPCLFESLYCCAESRMRTASSFSISSFMHTIPAALPGVQGEARSNSISSFVPLTSFFSHTVSRAVSEEPASASARVSRPSTHTVASFSPLRLDAAGAVGVGMGSEEAERERARSSFSVASFAPMSRLTVRPGSGTTQSSGGRARSDSVASFAPVRVTSPLAASARAAFVDEAAVQEASVVETGTTAETVATTTPDFQGAAAAVAVTVDEDVAVAVAVAEDEVPDEGGPHTDRVAAHVTAITVVPVVEAHTSHPTVVTEAVAVLEQRGASDSVFAAPAPADGVVPQLPSAAAIAELDDAGPSGMQVNAAVESGLGVGPAAAAPEGVSEPHPVVEAHVMSEAAAMAAAEHQVLAASQPTSVTGSSPSHPHIAIASFTPVHVAQLLPADIEEEEDDLYALPDEEADPQEHILAQEAHAARIRRVHSATAIQV